jgi:glycerol-3-phosphate acyltransferase PlsX
MTVIALDAMGGDFAPNVPVRAAAQAAREEGTEVILVGDQDAISGALKRRKVDPARVRIHHTPQAIAMDEPATSLLRAKAEASVRVAVELVAKGEAQAALSAGHSGAMMVAGKHVLHTLEGIERPAIATPLPLRKGVTVLLDSGANVDCKPHYLVQFAWMGEVYARAVLGLSEPRVGLLSNGGEPGKGNALAREAYELLRQQPFRFVGNIEARDLFKGKADVIVTDGFSGNLVLKTAEAANDQVRMLTREATALSPLARIGYWLMRGMYRDLERRKDYREIGGSLLLGVNGVVMICHGGSNVRAMRNAIRAARQCVESGLVERMARVFRERMPAAAAASGG